MKRKLIPCLLALALTASLSPSALAAQPHTVCYPTAVSRSEDGGEIRKTYDLGPEDAPAGIPRSDFEQDGFRYTLTDLLRQEAPEYEERTHTETVTVPSKSKDMEAVLALLPQTKEFTTEDGLSGTLVLALDTVKVEAAGYGSSTRDISATRNYPNLANQDTQYIPKTVEDSSNTLTLQTIEWQVQGDGHFTATATYTGTAVSSYVTGYTVTADYTGTVSRINLDKVRYVAVFAGTPLSSDEPEPSPDTGQDPDEPQAAGIPFLWGYVLIPLGAVALVGVSVGAALFIKTRRESRSEIGEESE